MSDLAATERPSPTRPTLRIVLAVAGRCTLILASVLLVLIGAHKAIHLADFRETISSHGVLNAEAAWLAAPSAAAMEILVGLCSLWLVAAADRPMRAGLVVSTVFLIFACYAALIAMDPPPVPTSCGCMSGSTNVQPADWTSLAIRNVLLAIATLATARIASPDSRRSASLT